MSALGCGGLVDKLRKAYGEEHLGQGILAGSFPVDGGFNGFFIRGAESIHWGRLLELPFLEQPLDAVVAEYEELKNLFRLPVQPVLFVSSLNHGDRIALLDRMPLHTLVFEYHVRRGDTGERVELFLAALHHRTLKGPSGAPKCGAAEAGGGTAGELSRDELAEILDISLELAQMARAS
ncbi:MAG: hypothetical protein WC352_06830 [Candidatus Omnitrophota bacterium]|jgi:hypothetical protein